MSALNVDGWMALDAINCVRQIATGAAAAAGLSLYRNSFYCTAVHWTLDRPEGLLKSLLSKMPLTVDSVQWQLGCSGSVW